MSRRCQISNKGSLKGNKVSHANNKSIKVSHANLQTKWLFDSETKTWIRAKVSSRVLRTIDKKGLAATLRDEGISIKDLQR